MLDVLRAGGVCGAESSLAGTWWAPGGLAYCVVCSAVRCAPPLGECSVGLGLFPLALLLGQQGP